MAYHNRKDQLPPRRQGPDGAERRVGVEIELAGIEPDELAQIVVDLYGGQINTANRTEIELSNTRFGTFHLELDASYLKSLEAMGQNHNGEDSSLGELAVDLIASAAELLVPWEVVTPPIPLSQLDELEVMIDRLRQHGALGTRHALHFAFGVHLNPELPDLRVTTLLAYLRAYLCLYEWISAQEHIDLTRKLSRYIQHFGKDYILQILDTDYCPDMATFSADYLHANPTRNRSLDLLPLLAEIDESRVRAVVDDPRIKARPTFHYRLPNCDIDNPSWNLNKPWSRWLAVEYLAQEPSLLDTLCQAYTRELERVEHLWDSSWASSISRYLCRL